MIKNITSPISSVYIVNSGNQGPTVIVFSGIHGDELSGVKANKKLFSLISKGDIDIKKGKLILVLEANEKAIIAGKRKITYNMNRIFSDTIFFGDSYEEKRVKKLMELIRQSDYLLDLHSTSGPSIPFAYAEGDGLILAQKCGISHVISGWSKLNENIIGGDSENYMNKHSGIGITFESGNHDNPNGEKEAYKILLNYLAVLEIIDYSYYKYFGDVEKKHIKIVGFYVALSNNFKYSININNFIRIKSGTEIGKDNGKSIYAEMDMILIMPKKEERIRKGTEVFFIGNDV